MKTKNKNSSKTIWVILFFIYSIYLSSAFYGVSFGSHWDEWVTTKQVTHSINNKEFGPTNFLYPSVLYYCGMASLIPIALYPKLAITETQNIHDFNWIKVSEDHRFRIILRLLLIFLSSLSIFWIFFAATEISSDQWVGLVAAGLFASSWEFQYHSRWIAPDALMTQFAALSIWLCVRDRFNLVLASLAIVFAASTKYNACFLMIMLWLSIYFRFSGLKRMRAFAISCLIFALGFVFLNFSAFINFQRFTEALQYQRLAYGQMGKSGFYLQPGLMHLKRMFTYLSLVVFSKVTVFSFIAFLLSIIGIYDLILRKRRLAIILLSFPLFYILFFSRYNLMFARNLLVLIPFFSIFSALMARKRIVSFIVMMIVAVNLSWQIYAARSIPRRFLIDPEATILEVVKNNPDKKYLFSRDLKISLQKRFAVQASSLKNIIDVEKNIINDDSIQVVFRASEVNYLNLTANIPFVYSQLPGNPWEVNLDYYPNWYSFHERLLIVPMTFARNFGISFD